MRIYKKFIQDFHFGKREFIRSFLATVFILFIAKCFFPNLTKNRSECALNTVASDTVSAVQKDTIALGKKVVAPSKKEAEVEENEKKAPQISQPIVQPQSKPPHLNMGILSKQQVKKHTAWVNSYFAHPHSIPLYLTAASDSVQHKILSVPQGYAKTFPDVNDVHMATAEVVGMQPFANRAAAAHCKPTQMVYVGLSPYYYVKPLYQSIPYLVPRASRLLSHIGRTFMDSLLVKGLRPNLIIVTSLTRTEEDVVKLRRFNANASDKSCHCLGTSFDISYNKYIPVQDPDAPPVTEERSDKLKWVLSEVLRDCRENGLCYIKYEHKQGCFHITAR